MVREANHDKDSNIKQDDKEVSRNTADDTLKVVYPYHKGC